MLAFAFTPDMIHLALFALVLVFGVVAKLTKGKNDTVSRVAEAIVEELVDHPHGSDVLDGARVRAAAKGDHVADHLETVVARAGGDAAPPA